MKKMTILAAMAALLTTTSCATIISGSRQTVKFDSTPNNASVFINDVEMGKTPFETKLERKKDHHVVIRLDGFQPYETSLTRKFNAWYIGNVGFGGLIGLIVDPITGAIYKLDQKEVNATLQQNTVANDVKKDQVIVTTSLKVDPNWVKVGQLEKL